MMFSIRNVCVAVLLLTRIQSFVLGISDNEKNDSKALIETVAPYLQLPWTDALGRLAHLSEYPDGEEVRVFIRAVESGETWALRILDTLWERQADILQKRTQDIELGNQCKDNDTDSQDKRCAGVVDTSTHGKGIDPPSVDRDPSPLYEAQDVENTNNTRRSGQVKSADFTIPEICTIISFTAIVVFLLCCTICDFVKRNGPANRSATLNTLAKFSLYTNAAALFEMKPTGETVDAIHGIRCLGCFSVLFGHHHMVWGLVMRHKQLLLEVMRGKHSWFIIYFEMTSFGNDTFIVISGFLVARIFFRIKQSGAEFNALKMYLYRYLRMTPCLAVTLLFVVVIFPHCGAGSMWETSRSAMGDPCREKWWINLLYLQNIVDPDPICLVHTWFLALDMQLFMLAPLILYPLHYSRKIGLRILSFLLVISLVTPAAVLAVNEYSNTVVRFDRDLFYQAKNITHYFFPTYNRTAPYLIGIFLGYDVATRKRNLSRANIAINWLLSGAVAIFCTWATHRIYNCAFAYDLRMEMASTVLLRPSWSIVIAWVIYASIQGYGGLVTRFLSLPMFVPFSRLSYCIYMVHMVIQVIRHTPSESSVAVLSSPLFDGVFGDLVISIGVAFILHLFIEMPCNILTKILLVSKSRKPELATIDTVEEPKKNL